MQLIRRVEQNLRYSRYSHSTLVDEKRGSYEFDCSGMTSWILRRAARKAHSAVVYRTKKNRLLARDYYHHLASLRSGSERWGWAPVGRVEDSAAGDVIAWLKPELLKSSNTGHVAFVVEPPRRLEGHENAYLLRIADASRYTHQDDTRELGVTSGFGFGTILVLADPETGAPVAYGWFGTRSAWVLTTSMAIGRPLR
jgi:hypothetical protein